MSRNRFGVLVSMCASLIAHVHAQQVVHKHDPCEWEHLFTEGHLARKNGQFDRALEYQVKALELAENGRDLDLMARSHTEAGLTHLARKNMGRVWYHWLKALDLYGRTQDQEGLAEIYNYLGVGYYEEGQFERSVEYFNMSLDIRKQIGTDYDIAVVLNNLGSIEAEYGDLDKAIVILRDCVQRWRGLGKKGWIGQTYGHLAACHARAGNSDSTKWYLSHGSDLLQNSDPIYQAPLHLALGRWEIEYGSSRAAIINCNKSLAAAEEHASIDLQINSFQCLADAYEKIGDIRMAYSSHKKAVQLRDSTSIDKHGQEIAIIRANYDFDKKHYADSLRTLGERLRADVEHATVLSAERGRRNLLLITTLAVLLLSIGLYHRLRFIRRSRILIQHERDRADQLLHNILPGQIADELLAQGMSEAREYQQATVLFTDFHGFTQIAENLTAQALVSLIDESFSEFDRICREHGVEKIKTVGDCYMACGGVPDPDRGAPADVVRAAIALQVFIEEKARERMGRGEAAFTMRVGIHTGPVVAGIVGLDKFAFDIWGDTVNIAARMENSGEVGRVNISEATFDLIKHEPGLHFIPRGLVNAKGKGRLQMYFVEQAVVPDLVADQLGSSEM